MVDTSVSRRVFLGSVAGGLTLSALNRRVLASRKPNDQVVLGMIGVGGMGTGRLRQFLEHPDARIGAICDVDRAHVDRAVAEVEKAGAHRPKTFGDFRRVLEDPGIDAVAIVTPDHWHALASVRAFEAGKDVFVEKPLSYSVAEGRMMVDASLKYKRVTQMGNHIHNDEIEYPNLLVVFSLRPTPLPGFEHLGGVGCLFQGTEAWLATNYTENEVWVKGRKVDDFPRPDPTIPDSPGHLREWLDAIKSRNLDTTCNVRYGHRVTKPGLLANVSYRTGRRLQWNDETERVIDDNGANRYLSRRFRNQYKL